MKGYRGVALALIWPSFALFLVVDLPRVCLVVAYEVGGRVSFGGFFQRVLCLRPIHFSSPRVDWMRIEKQLTIVDPGFSVKTW